MEEAKLFSDDRAPIFDLVTSFLGPPAPTKSLKCASGRKPDEKATAGPGPVCAVDRSAASTVVVFSKDRPWQLQQLLRSMGILHQSSRCSEDKARPTCESRGGGGTETAAVIHLFIIAAISSEFEEGYLKVRKEYCGNHDDVRVFFLTESGATKEKLGQGSVSASQATINELDIATEGSFTDLLEDVVGVSDGDEPSDDVTNNDDSSIMFLTDDCVFLEPLRNVLQVATGCLCSNEVFSFLSRLHPGVTWCQTKDEPCLPPRNSMHVGGRKVGTALIFDRHEGNGDWAYPFDLSGGVYRRCDVVAVLQHIRSQEPKSSKARHTCGYSHPNLLEINGNNAIASADREAMQGNKNSTAEKGDISESLYFTASIGSKCAAPTHPCLLIVAINRVQNVCKAPLATTACSIETSSKPFHGAKSNIAALADSSVKEYTPLALLKLLQQNRHFDLDTYRACHFNSSHIGSMLLLPAREESRSVSARLGNDIQPALSVLIPIHKGPITAAAHAMASILLQPIEENEQVSNFTKANKVKILYPMQIVLVDDQCSDGSIDAMIEVAKEVQHDHDGVIIALHDHRRPSGKEGTLGNEERMRERHGAIDVWIDIVASPGHGVSSALNFGLMTCKGEYVARMDADDVASPRRLLTQLLAFRVNPNINAMGTCSIIFSDSEEEADLDYDKGFEGAEPDLGDAFPSALGNRALAEPETSQLCLPYSSYVKKAHRKGKHATRALVRPIRVSVPPSDPGFAAWTMLFSCSLSHPSVMFRKEAINDIGGYNESLLYAEDHELWLRLTSANCRSVMSLPIIGLWHRKHSSSSTSGSNTLKQEKESFSSSRRAMQGILGNVGSTLAVSDEIVAVLRNPISAPSMISLGEAARLLVEIEKAFLQFHVEKLTERESKLIGIDCDARLGELATSTIEKYGKKGTTGSGAWKIWCERCPDLHMERIALLCHCRALEK